ncbi:MAG: T9SS type A sorting domain-containing protein [Bacteroidales bacterium]|nr:T9SS type A sorting domain-containing protein [Bacteroidales bacterium]
MVERGDDYAVLEWEMGGDSCQLSVAPYDVAADSGLVFDLTTTSHTVSGLDTGVYYAARLRTQCRHHCHIHTDTVVWSGWGAPTLFYLGSEEPDTSGIGIRRVEEAVEFSVTPNPARGTATVRCEAGLRGVEVVSATGSTVLSLGGGGAQACVLDLTGLAKGIYIVRITTPQGTAVQKLAVE